MLGGVLVGDGNVASVLNLDVATIDVIIAITQTQGVLLVDLPLKAQLWTPLADVLAVLVGQ